MIVCAPPGRHRYSIEDAAKIEGARRRYDRHMSIDDLPTRDIRQTAVDPQLDRPVEIDDVPLVEELERYQASGVIGKGGMGEVRLYKDLRISRYVAVKVLRDKLRSSPEYRSRFVLEARLQGQLEHPSIVPVHDLGVTPEGELFFSMARVRGVTLRAALETVRAGDHGARFVRRRLLTAFSSVCLAVDYAHCRGVVHRDLKPENVMLGDFGEVYVLDWGIAKVMHSMETFHAWQLQQLLPPERSESQR
jgi:serine/threonine protein kinase